MSRAPWEEKPSSGLWAARTGLLVLLAVCMLFPFIYVFAVSFSSYQDVLGGGLILFPKHPSLEAYATIFRGGIVTRALTVSIGVTIVGTLVNMLLTVSMAYALTRPIPGSRV